MKKAQCAHPPPHDNDNVVGTNQCLCLPKAELDYSCRLKSASATAEKRVAVRLRSYSQGDKLIFETQFLTEKVTFVWAKI